VQFNCYVPPLPLPRTLLLLLLFAAAFVDAAAVVDPRTSVSK